MTDSEQKGVKRVPKDHASRWRVGMVLPDLITTPPVKFARDERCAAIKAYRIPSWGVSVRRRGRHASNGVVGVHTTNQLPAMSAPGIYFTQHVTHPQRLGYTVHSKTGQCRRCGDTASCRNFFKFNAYAYHLLVQQPRVLAPWGAAHVTPSPCRIPRPLWPRGQ